MSKLKRRFIYYIGFIFLLLTIGCGGDDVLNNRPSFPSKSLPPLDPTECGYDKGDVACDFKLIDQNKKEVTLHEHYGKVILLDFSTGWCGYCRVAARGVEETQSKYEDQGFIYITVLIESMSHDPPEQSFIELWAETFGIEAPVLKGSMDLVKLPDHEGWLIHGWPTFVVIGRDMKIVKYIVGFDKEQIDSSILSSF